MAALLSCSVFMYLVCSPRMSVLFPVLLKNDFMLTNSFIMFAAPLAIRPNVISNIGPIPATARVAMLANCFAPSLRPLNPSRIFPTNSIIGVTAFRNASPTGASFAFTSSIDFWNLYIGESETFFISRSDRIASSSAVSFAKPATLFAWLPSSITFLNNVEIRANWNLPNNCSIARARFSGSSVSKALAIPITVALTSPLLFSTIPLTLILKPARKSDAFLLGLIMDARPDLSALAPSDALIPPSFIAVRKNVRSSTLPPSCLTTGAAFGIAIVRSSIEVTVWFSTALRKSIFPASSSVDEPKAFVSDMVVSSAWFWSTLPSTASLLAC